MQSFHFTSIVLAIFCGLAVAAHHETECVKVACSSFDETLQETIITLSPHGCPPSKKWCCPESAFENGEKSLTLVNAYAASCRQARPQ
ncbi:hypothetical protein H4Q26_002349 [Puccinia striiformis f. sp. tritici PST-130]|nr:hypothetical protein Pst134EB_016361 [Puccinia striiformis f. sp. tritici]KAI9603039.1 hypothetical protein H4Q26_002349 [Puccinia striiformis f. sp. tritici PST-130]